jgi:hypothetical protein
VSGGYKKLAGLGLSTSPYNITKQEQSPTFIKLSTLLNGMIEHRRYLDQELSTSMNTWTASKYSSVCLKIPKNRKTFLRA